MAHPHSQEWAGLLRRALAVMLSGALLVIQQGSSFEALAGAAVSAKAAKAGTGGLRAPGGVSGVPNGVAGRAGSLSGSVTLKPGLNGVLSSAGPGLRPSVAPAAAAQVTLPAASAAPAESISRPAVHSTLNRDRGTRVFQEEAPPPQAAARLGGAEAERQASVPRVSGSLRTLGKKVAAAPAAALDSFFDQGRRLSGNGSADFSEPRTDAELGSLRVHIVRPGQAPVAIDMASLERTLEAEPELAAALNASGKIRVVTNGGVGRGRLSPDEIEQVRARMRRLGLNAAVQVERIVIEETAGGVGDSSAHAQDGIPPPARTVAKSGIRRYLLDALTAPLREARFLARTFIASFTWPSRSEILMGLATKSVPFGINVATWWAMIGPAHPWALAAALALSLYLESFHGAFINTWTNFQNSLHRQRSGAYQITFNFLYMQSTGALFRYFSWIANPGKVAPPWSVQYWRDLGVMTIVGTVFGSLGYQGLNRLYEKGVITRFHRSMIQQLRDLMFLVAGPFFAAGAMNLFWLIFLIQQSIDLALFIAGIAASKRVLVYVSDPAVAASAAFQAMYPAAVGAPEESMARQAFRGLLDNPLFWPFIGVFRVARWAYRKLFGSGGGGVR